MLRRRRRSSFSGFSEGSSPVARESVVSDEPWVDELEDLGRRLAQGVKASVGEPEGIRESSDEQSDNSPHYRRRRRQLGHHLNHFRRTPLADDGSDGDSDAQSTAEMPKLQKSDSPGPVLRTPASRRADRSVTGEHPSIEDSLALANRVFALCGSEVRLPSQRRHTGSTLAGAYGGRDRTATDPIGSMSSAVDEEDMVNLGTSVLSPPVFDGPKGAPAHSRTGSAASAFSVRTATSMDDAQSSSSSEEEDEDGDSADTVRVTTNSPVMHSDSDAPPSPLSDDDGPSDSGSTGSDASALDGPASLQIEGALARRRALANRGTMPLESSTPAVPPPDSAPTVMHRSTSTSSLTPSTALPSPSSAAPSALPSAVPSAAPSPRSRTVQRAADKFRGLLNRDAGSLPSSPRGDVDSTLDSDESSLPMSLSQSNLLSGIHSLSQSNVLPGTFADETADVDLTVPEGELVPPILVDGLGDKLRQQQCLSDMRQRVAVNRHKEERLRREAAMARNRETFLAIAREHGLRPGDAAYRRLMERADELNRRLEHRRDAVLEA